MTSETITIARADLTAEVSRALIRALNDVYVIPAVRGTGLGRRLVAALEGEARELGVRRLVLETGVRQEAACRRCYHSLVIDWSECAAVERDPGRVSGAWVFIGTRVPVAALFENLEDDASLHEFVEWFPGVTAEQARAVLEYAARSSLAVA